MKRLILLASLFFSFSATNSLLGQSKVKQVGPDFANFPSDACFGDNGRIFLSTQGGIYLSDNGGDWEKINTYFNNIYFNEGKFLKDQKSNIFVWDQSGVYFTSDNGKNWNDWYSFFLDFGNYQNNSIAVQGDTLFVATTKGMGYSFKDKFFATPYPFLSNKNIIHIEIKGKSILAFTDDSKGYLSNDRGNNWINLPTIPFTFDKHSSHFARKDSRIFISVTNAVWFTNDFGLTWQSKSINLPLSNFNTTFITDIRIDGDEIFICSDDKISKSTLDAATWQTVSSVKPRIDNFAIQANAIINLSNNQILRSNDRGNTWASLKKNGIHDAYFAFSNLDKKSGTIYFSGSNTWSFQKRKDDSQFTSFKDGLMGEVYIKGDTLYGPINSSGIILYDRLSGDIIDRFTYSPDLGLPQKIVNSKKQFFVSTINNGIFNYSEQNIWKNFNNGLSSFVIYDFILKDTSLYIGTDNGLYRSGVNSPNWKKIDNSNDSPVNSITTKDSIIITGSSRGDITISVDNGITWLKSANVGLSGGVTDLVFDEKRLLATTNGNFFFSNDTGSTWNEIILNSSIKYSLFPQSVVANKDSIYVGTIENGIFAFSKDLLKITPSITWSNPSDIVYGTTLSNTQLNATGSVDGTFVYTPASGSKLNAGSTQNLSVTFTPTDAANYASATKQVTINVGKASQQITFSALTDKTFGDAPFTISAAANSSLPLSFATTSDKVTISGSQVTIVKPGRVTITAAQTGNTNYTAATSVDQSFCIKPAKPTVAATNLVSSSPTLTSNNTTGNQWYFNGTALAGATNQTLSATQSGTYKVQVKADDCASEFSADQVLVVTGDIASSNESIELYPNPVTYWLTVSLGNEEGKKEVVLYQLTGQQLASQRVSGNEAKFFVGEFAKGLYIAKVISGTSTKVIKFEKQ